MIKLGYLKLVCIALSYVELGFGWVGFGLLRLVEVRLPEVGLSFGWVGLVFDKVKLGCMKNEVRPGEVWLGEVKLHEVGYR